MAFLLPFTTRQVCKAMAESMVKYDNAQDKDDFCNPDVALVVKLKNKKYEQTCQNELYAWVEITHVSFVLVFCRLFARNHCCNWPAFKKY